MAPAATIRPAAISDAAALASIYRPFVESTAVSFETVPPTAAHFESRIARIQADWTWLVAEIDGRCVGYAYGSMHRERPAYKWSVEVSAYIDPSYHRQGLGRALYSQLFEALSAQGYCNTYAGITLPNEGSVALHRAMGFEVVGTFKAVGRKFCRWHDVMWLQRRLRDDPPFE